MKKISFPKNHILQKPGDLIEEFWILLNGEIEVYTQFEEIIEFIIERLH
jgi:CRP-like cAMP-binding protein